MMNKKMISGLILLLTLFFVGCQPDQGPTDFEKTGSGDAPSSANAGQAQGEPLEKTPVLTDSGTDSDNPAAVTPTPEVTQAASEGKPYVEEQNIHYGTADGVKLMLDLVKPVTGEGPFPAIVFIHGGGFVTGARYEMLRHSRLAAQEGYVATTVDYRLINVLNEESLAKYPFPAQVYDVKCAIRWLRANAEEHQIDPDRIGVLGHSAGAYLALMAALVGPSDGLEGDCGDMNYSSRVQAAVSLAGVADLVKDFEELPSKDAEVMYSFFIGGAPEEMPERYQLASPITYVSEDDPPIFSMIGEKDTMVLPVQGEILDMKMNEVGVFHELIILEGRDHFYVGNPISNVFTPIFEFFDQHLKESGS